MSDFDSLSDREKLLYIAAASNVEDLTGEETIQKIFEKIIEQYLKFNIATSLMESKFFWESIYYISPKLVKKIRDFVEENGLERFCFLRLYGIKEGDSDEERRRKMDETINSNTPFTEKELKKLIKGWKGYIKKNKPEKLKKHKQKIVKEPTMDEYVNKFNEDLKGTKKHKQKIKKTPIEEVKASIVDSNNDKILGKYKKYLIKQPTIVKQPTMEEYVNKFNEDLKGTKKHKQKLVLKNTEEDTNIKRVYSPKVKYTIDDIDFLKSELKRYEYIGDFDENDKVADEAIDIAMDIDELIEKLIRKSNKGKKPKEPKKKSSAYEELMKEEEPKKEKKPKKTISAYEELMKEEKPKKEKKPKKQPIKEQNIMKARSDIIINKTTKKPSVSTEMVVKDNLSPKIKRALVSSIKGEMKNKITNYKKTGKGVFIDI